MNSDLLWNLSNLREDNREIVNRRFYFGIAIIGCLAASNNLFAQQSAKDLTLVRGKPLHLIFVEGTQDLHGAQQKFAMYVSDQFQYLMQAEGDLPEIDGFDGKISWHLNGSGVPHPTSGSDRDISRLEAYVQAGVWASKDSPVQVVSEKGNDLVIKCRDGKFSANLTLDPVTHTAKTLSSWGPDGPEVWTFSDYRSDVSPIPGKIVHKSGDATDTTMQTPRGFDGEVYYGMPEVKSDGYKFDLSANTNIEVKRIGGYLFVKPLLDGKDEGWWFLDTGAEVMVVDPKVARDHNMKIVGKDSVAGVVASSTMSFSKGVSFQLGPVTIKNSSYVELDLTPFSGALGIKLAGICGYDFISRVSLDIDPKKATIGVYPPGNNPLPEGAVWTAFQFKGDLPSLTCKFEGDHEGIFSLDTGSNSTVDFFTPTVNKFELLKDRKVSNVMTGGAGGASESKSGILEWFTMGPKRFEKPRVGLQITTKGGFASPFVDGNIGMGFMAKFRMILDYQKSKLALIESK